MSLTKQQSDTSAHDLDSQLVQRLADGGFHSGEQLGLEFGVSRATIHNHIEKLTTLGLDIFRVTGKGYRLAKPIQLLSSDKVRIKLPHELRELPLYLNHVTGSTNDDIRSIITNGTTPGTSVLAEMQTHGRGRRGKQWHSPFGSNLYLSIYWPLLQGLNAAMGLSVALGLAVAESLTAAGIQEVSVKWPNDVYIQRKKVAGILVELEGQAGGEGQAIIGIGLNLAMQDTEASIDQPYTSVMAHLDKPLDRNWWASELIKRCIDRLTVHDQQNLKGLLDVWREYDHFYQQPVRLILGQHEQIGVGKGIDEFGALLVQQSDGLKRYFGGEISVRNATT
ncbi:bifunctional biotin--[acetyl-CoA-carboxylase] synthetase/biotin operon repressor [Aliidiomarina iranensis]|uniref:Bifunctional ligase/repressor BirA n=1 Tax=Aliidiomarina iranensis TaxID=1434071 RepID=A0A432VUC0_9GAMM|nr:bifunctional biotin--[acetyl-CoA-carboxylase] ligase/biotin operon repressor BirA [Aliidiomarina iranensis]RUO19936.1 bifunctional biotin--[acetyl-CoA-carboxylase] synthetase/biotin operon repressor [Aliidiomarina iranensis]